jgi:hypothetical protein
MPVSAREMFLIIRAKDEASRVLRGLSREFGMVNAARTAAAHRTLAAGSALASVGVGIGLVGAAGIKFLKDSTDAAIEYNRQASLTKTQVDGIKVSVQDLERVSSQVAHDIGVPLETLQPALYDIFSSMDVGLSGASKMLRGFGKAAVAGQTDVQTAGRATIALMNAFNIPVSKLNNVLDFQFQLVRKGVGTYEEFASTIGRAIPSAANAGQTYQTLGGILAYLTRNGPKVGKGCQTQNKFHLGKRTAPRHLDPTMPSTERLRFGQNNDGRNSSGLIRRNGNCRNSTGLCSIP